MTLLWPSQKKALRYLCRNDLFFLLAFVLRRRDVRRAVQIPKRGKFLFERCREVEAEPNDRLDLWAREHYKSTIITFAKTIQDILRSHGDEAPDPNEVTVGIFSHTRPNAKKFLIQIKQEFETNDMLKKLFNDILWADPRQEAPKWSEDEGIVVRRKNNPKEATVSAWGLVDGMPTGAHFMLRVYDDTVTRESVTTPEQIKKTTEAWELSDNLGAEGGTQRYIGTRYSLHDTYAEMIKRGIKVRRHTATHNSRLDGIPVLFSDKYWAHKLKTQSRSTLAAQMLQNPLAAEEAVFQPLWLRSYEVRPRSINVAILCDPSGGKHRRSDRTAMPVIGVGPSSTRFLLDGYCHRMSLSQRWVALRDLYMRWKSMPGVQHVVVGYEKYGMQADIEYFQERMEIESKGKPIDKQVFFPIIELNWVHEGTKGEQGKRQRVERLEPDHRNGRLFLPLAVWHDGKGCTWSVDIEPDSATYQQVVYKEVEGLTKQQRMVIDAGSPDLIAKAIKRVDEERQMYDLTERYVEEYLTFPFGTHDDLLDAVSRVYDVDLRPPLIVSPGSTDPRTYHDT